MSRSPRCAACSWRYIARFTAVALLALTTSVPGAAARPHGRTFGGRTTQSDPFVLALSRGRIDHAVLWVDADCDDGDDITYSANAALRAAIGSKGRIRAKRVSMRDYGDAIASVSEQLGSHVAPRARPARSR